MIILRAAEPADVLRAGSRRLRFLVALVMAPDGAGVIKPRLWINVGLSKPRLDRMPKVRHDSRVHLIAPLPSLIPLFAGAELV
ncbi:MAG: hypothetical protein ACJ8AH_06845 [Stellaceae bacterium]